MKPKKESIKNKPQKKIKNQVKTDISKNLYDNINFINNIFAGDRTIKTRKINPANDSFPKVVIFFVDGLVNDLIINQNIIEPLVKTDLSLRYENENNTASPEIISFISESILYGNDISYSDDMEKITNAILTGDTALLIDGCQSGMIISTKSWHIRSVEEPESERVIDGPHEGFTESIMVNLSLIRRRITNKNLKYEFCEVGEKSNTVLCICYMHGLADEKILRILRKRIKNIEIDCIFDTEYVDEIIHDKKYSLFRTTGKTERPDVVSAKLLEGRIAILINGSPVVATIPYVFAEYFSNCEDYYCDSYYASFNRILRIVGFLTTISLPAVYLSLVTFHHEMLPLKFLLSAAASRVNMPFSSFAEMMILIVTFELIREGSARIPSSIGTAFSIVGGIVLGQASVEANFVSLPIVIIVAFAGITGLIVPQLKGPVIFIRFFLLILADILGLFGYMLGILFLLFMVSSMDSFTVPYSSLTIRDKEQLAADTFIRMPWKHMLKRPKVSATEDVIRQKNDD